MNRPAAGRAPWTNGDLVAAGAVVALGALVCGLAWTGASAYSQLRLQTGWVAVGVAGFLLAVAGQAVWLLRGRRAVSSRAAAVLAEAAVLTPAMAGGPARGLAPDERLVAADGMRHFHRPACPIAAGRTWPALSRSAHEAAGRTPCGICFRGPAPDRRAEP